jgi:hypothetical protein
VGSEKWKTKKEGVDVMAGKQRRGKVHTDLHGGSPFDGLKQPFEEKDQILLAMNAVAVNVMARKRKADERWGLDRLAELVSEETRLRFWKQLARCRLAYQARDVEGYRSACGGMIRAYDALEKEAESLGADPVTVDVMEGQRDDGTVFGVAANADSAWAYSLQRPSVDVWTLEELAVILAAPVFTQAVRLKREIPGCEVMSIIVPDDVEPVFGGKSEGEYALSDKEILAMQKVGELSRKGSAK